MCLTKNSLPSERDRTKKNTAPGKEGTRKEEKEKGGTARVEKRSTRGREREGEKNRDIRLRSCRLGISALAAQERDGRG